MIKAIMELSRLAAGFSLRSSGLRDEAHRFAIAYHRRRRGRAFLNDHR